MKPLSFLLFCASTLLLVACDSGGDDDSEQLESRELPAAIQSFLTSTFPGESIRFSERYATGFEVVLNNGIEIEFNGAGDWLDIDGGATALPGRALALVPTRAVTTARQRFNSPIVEIDRTPAYGFDLQVASGQDLEFNSNGELLRID
jgi:hypothetical protein